MNEETKRELSSSARRIIEAMVHKALSRCDELGIAREDFYRIMQEEKKLHPKGTVQELFERIFRRLGADLN